MMTAITQGSRELRACPFRNLLFCFNGADDDSEPLLNILLFFYSFHKFVTAQ